MKSQKILGLLLCIIVIQIQSNQAVIAASEAKFKPYTTTAKVKFYVKNEAEEIPYYIQGGTLASSGKEGLVVTRLTEADITVNASNVREYELPDGAPKVLVVGYTNWSFYQYSLGVVVVGTQDGFYALLWEDPEQPETGLTGGFPQGDDANMANLDAGYWANATLQKIFVDEIAGNIVAMAGQGNGVYYVHRGISLEERTDTVYRFLPENFADGIGNAIPTKLIISGKNGAPAAITTLEVVVSQGDLKVEQLLIGSHKGAYITTVEGGIQQADVTAEDVTLELISTTKDQIIKAFIPDEDNTFNIVGRSTSQTINNLSSSTVPVTFDDQNAPVIGWITIIRTTGDATQAATREYIFPPLLLSLFPAPTLQEV